MLCTWSRLFWELEIKLMMMMLSITGGGSTAIDCSHGRRNLLRAKRLAERNSHTSVDGLFAASFVKFPGGCPGRGKRASLAADRHIIVEIGQTKTLFNTCGTPKKLKNCIRVSKKFTSIFEFFRINNSINTQCSTSSTKLAQPQASHPLSIGNQ